MRRIGMWTSSGPRGTNARWKRSLVLLALLLGGCSGAAQHRASTASLTNSSVPGISASAATSSAYVHPTPTVAPTTSEGALTAPVPAGVRAITVTLVEPGTGAKIIYRKMISDPSTMQQLISDVDGLHVAGNATQGCVPSPVDLQMEFTTPTSDATFNEDSQCARATLTLAGSTGPTLGSALLFEVEKLLGVSVTTGPDGQPSVGPS